MKGAAPAAWRRALGSALGLGLLPRAPGTWGSLGTVLAVALLAGVTSGEDGLAGLLGAGPAGASAAAAPGGPAGLLAGREVVLLLVAGLTVLCALLGRRAVDDWGRSDPGPFVLDEVAGQLLALVPAFPGPPRLGELALGFALFRLFDVTKPPPCRRLEGLAGGWGIVADDLMAGAYAAAVLVLARPLWA